MSQLHTGDMGHSPDISLLPSHSRLVNSSHLSFLPKAECCSHPSLILSSDTPWGPHPFWREAQPLQANPSLFLQFPCIQENHSWSLCDCSGIDVPQPHSGDSSCTRVKLTDHLCSQTAPVLALLYPSLAVWLWACSSNSLGHQGGSNNEVKWWCMCRVHTRSGTAFVLSGVQSTLSRDAFSTWASSGQQGGNMPCNGPLRCYGGKLSGPGSLSTLGSGWSTLWFPMCPQVAVQ